MFANVRDELPLVVALTRVHVRIDRERERERERERRQIRLPFSDSPYSQNVKRAKKAIASKDAVRVVPIYDESKKMRRVKDQRDSDSDI